MRNQVAKLSDLMDPVEFESLDHRMLFDRQTAKTVIVEQSLLTAVEENDEEFLTDVSDFEKEEIEIARAIINDSGDRFIEPPNKFEFHEYRHMERFIGSLTNVGATEQL